MSEMAEDAHAGWGARTELSSAFSVLLFSDMGQSSHLEAEA